ncbi:MAG: hypothetical protein ABSD74_17290 [Rhizomicrobium sp.]
MLSVGLLTSPVAGANAAVTISSAATENMTCTAGVCTPTAANAVLNVGDLTTMLGSGNVTVNTGTGSLASEVEDIVVDASFNWASASSLTLDAHRSITVDQPVAVKGPGGMLLVTNDGGTGGILYFGSTGNISFAKTSSPLSINGLSYTLESSLPALASAIASNPAGAYALSRNYNAGHNGTYASSPIPTTFAGSFSGLGNTISNLTIDDLTEGDYTALFSRVSTGATVASVRLTGMNLQCNGCAAGGVAALSEGTIANASAEGSIGPDSAGAPSDSGGLVGYNHGGTILLSYADVNVSVSDYVFAGGLAGASDGATGAIIQSYATGTTVAGVEGSAGGLVASNAGVVSECYALGAVSGRRDYVGGLLGANGGAVSQAYSTGKEKDAQYKQLKGDFADFGGFVAYDAGSDITAGYWDTTTSGFNKLGHGAGNIKNDSGITGLTTTQLQAGLPAGFDPTIWAENPSINNGLPYLIANPPQ